MNYETPPGEAELERRLWAADLNHMEAERLKLLGKRRQLDTQLARLSKRIEAHKAKPPTGSM